MTAHDVSDLNHDWLQSDNLCAVIDRAYRGIASIRKVPIRYNAFDRADEFPWIMLLLRAIPSKHQRSG